MNPVFVPPVFQIFLGDTKTLPMKAVFEGTFAPLDLTSATEIVVRLPLAAGGFLELKKTLGQVTVTDPTNLGLFAAPITSDNSLLLNPGTLQDIFVVFTISGMDNSPFTVPYRKCFSVFE